MPLAARARWQRTLGDYAVLAAGSAVMGFGISSLIVPARLADGGVTGVAIAIHYILGPNVGLLYALLNVPLLAWAWFAQGFRFLWRTLVGVALVSAATGAFAPLHLVLGDRLLAALYGGLCVGTGVGLVLRAGGSTGGADILARYLHRHHGWSFSQTFLLTDLVVLSSIAVFVGLPAAMYALVNTFIAGQVVGYVIEGPRRARLGLIITGDETALSARIVSELGRGATRLRAIGAYTGADRAVLLVAIAPQELLRLRALVAAADPRAFLIVLPAAEVLGEGFFSLAATEEEA